MTRRRRVWAGRIPRCQYCGLLVPPRKVRYVVMDRQRFPVHRRHPKRRDEAAG